MTEKRYEDSHWTETQVLTLDYHGTRAEGVGEPGLRDEDLEELASTLGILDRELTAARQSGRLAFLELPCQVHVLPEIRALTKPLLEWCWQFVVLATDALAVGVKARRQALCHPQHNYMPIGQRHHRPGLWGGGLPGFGPPLRLAGPPAVAAHRL
jgi:hypothetical protein